MPKAINGPIGPNHFEEEEKPRVDMRKVGMGAVGLGVAGFLAHRIVKARGALQRAAKDTELKVLAADQKKVAKEMTPKADLYSRKPLEIPDTRYEPKKFDLLTETKDGKTRPVIAQGMPLETGVRVNYNSKSGRSRRIQVRTKPGGYVSKTGEFDSFQLKTEQVRDRRVKGNNRVIKESKPIVRKIESQPQVVAPNKFKEEKKHSIFSPNPNEKLKTLTPEYRAALHRAKDEKLVANRERLRAEAARAKARADMANGKPNPEFRGDGAEDQYKGWKHRTQAGADNRFPDPRKKPSAVSGDPYAGQVWSEEAGRFTSPEWAAELKKSAQKKAFGRIMRLISFEFKPRKRIEFLRLLGKPKEEQQEEQPKPESKWKRNALIAGGAALFGGAYAAPRVMQAMAESKIKKNVNQVAANQAERVAARFVGGRNIDRNVGERLNVPASYKPPIDPKTMKPTEQWPEKIKRGGNTFKRKLKAAYEKAGKELTPEGLASEGRQHAAKVMERYSQAKMYSDRVKSKKADIPANRPIRDSEGNADLLPSEKTKIGEKIRALFGRTKKPKPGAGQVQQTPAPASSGGHLDDLIDAERRAAEATATAKSLAERNANMGKAFKEQAAKQPSLEKAVEQGKNKAYQEQRKKTRENVRETVRDGTGQAPVINERGGVSWPKQDDLFEKHAVRGVKADELLEGTKKEAQRITNEGTKPEVIQAKIKERLTAKDPTADVPSVEAITNQLAEDRVRSRASALVPNQSLVEKLEKTKAKPLVKDADGAWVPMKNAPEKPVVPKGSTESVQSQIASFAKSREQAKAAEETTRKQASETARMKREAEALRLKRQEEARPKVYRASGVIETQAPTIPKPKTQAEATKKAIERHQRRRVNKHRKNLPDRPTPQGAVDQEGDYKITSYPPPRPGKRK